MQNTGLPRRTFLMSTGTAAAVTLLSHGALSGRPPEATAAITETGEQDHILFASASALVEEMRNKRLSPVEVVNADIAHIERINPKLGAVEYLAAEQALTEARAAETAIMTGRVDWQRQPLMGLPVSIKSSIDVTGMPSRNGDPSFTNCRHPDATVVEKIRAAGGIVLAKRRMPFRASAFESDCIFGRANNPYDLSRTPGGSSGGEGALAAAGGSPLGIATDGDGSLLAPASYTGLAGLVRRLGGCQPLAMPTAAMGNQIHSGVPNGVQ